MAAGMKPELVTLCMTKYGERWWLGLSKDISEITGSPLRKVQRTVLRWVAVTASPPPASEAAVRLLTATKESGGVVDR